MRSFECPAPSGYRFEIGSGHDLALEDRLAIAALVISRGEVGAVIPHRYLPRAQLVAVARHQDLIVSVAVLKCVRVKHNKTVRESSGFPLQAGVPEFGYVATGKAHEGKHLGGCLSTEVLRSVSGAVFSTVRVDNRRMRGMLERRGFHEASGAWSSDRGQHEISLWIRDE